MKLWTIQSMERWQRLQRDGVLRAHRFDAEFYCQPIYEWMRQKLVERVGTPPVEGLYPLWAWQQWTNARAPRPDLRCAGHFPRGTRAVRIEFELEPDQILLSAFSLWHFPLNLSPIPEEALTDDEDFDKFDVELEDAGFPRPIDWTTFESLMKHPQLGAIFRKSWEKIFDLDWHYPELSEPRHLKSIQGVFWELRKENIGHVDFFTAR